MFCGIINSVSNFIFGTLGLGGIPIIRDIVIDIFHILFGNYDFCLFT